MSARRCSTFDECPARRGLAPPPRTPCREARATRCLRATRRMAHGGGPPSTPASPPHAAASRQKPGNPRHPRRPLHPRPICRAPDTVGSVRSSRATGPSRLPQPAAQSRLTSRLNEMFSSADVRVAAHWKPARRTVILKGLSRRGRTVEGKAGRKSSKVLRTERIGMWWTENCSVPGL